MLFLIAAIAIATALVLLLLLLLLLLRCCGATVAAATLCMLVMSVTTVWVCKSGANDHQLYRTNIYNIDAVPYESLMVGLFSLITAEVCTDRSTGLSHEEADSVFVAFSRDGWSWSRPPPAASGHRTAFLDMNASSLSAWNYQNVQSAGGGFLVINNTLRFFVGARRCAKNSAGQCQNDAAFTGSATLRRDGFASYASLLDAPVGLLTTKPLMWDHMDDAMLFVNAQPLVGCTTAPSAAACIGDGCLCSVSAEVLDARTLEVIMPFSRSLLITADSTREQVHWPANKSLSDLSGRTVRLRFYLVGFRLFSFWISADACGASGGYVAAGGEGLDGSTDMVGSCRERIQLKSDDEPLVLATSQCPCSSSELCTPLQSPAPEYEIVAYASGYSYPPAPQFDGWTHMNWSAVTTIVRQYRWPIMLATNGSVLLKNEMWSSQPGSEQDLICTAHKHNVRVVYCVDSQPEFHNDEQLTLLQNPLARSAAARGLADAGRRFGFDGIQFDFEKLNSSDEIDLLTLLVRETKAAFALQHARISITIPTHKLADNSSLLSPNMARASPLANLTAASTAVFLMAYDMASATHPGFSAAHPADSPLNGVQLCLQQLVRSGVSASKIVLGLPFIGLQYECRHNTTESPHCTEGRWSEQISYWEVKQLMQEQTSLSSSLCRFEWDNDTSTPFYVCSEDATTKHCGALSADRRPGWTGETRCSGWYDDASSLQLKAALAVPWGLRGVGVFNAEAAGPLANSRCDCSSVACVFFRD
eukprot:COSAG05_NODE_158_length_15673_cov_23.898946_2_plen_760_part_00